MMAYGCRPSPSRIDLRAGASSDSATYTGDVVITTDGPIDNQNPTEECLPFALSAGALVAGGGVGPRMSEQALFVMSRRRERARTGDVMVQDRGTNAFDMLNAATEEGVVPRSLWPFDPRSTIAELPVSVELSLQKAFPKDAVRDITDAFETESASALYRGRPTMFSMHLDAPYETYDGSAPWQGMVGPRVGTHMQLMKGLVMVGGELCAIVRNSWGEAWGRLGLAIIPLRVLVAAQLESYVIEKGPSWS